MSLFFYFLILSFYLFFSSMQYFICFMFVEFFVLLGFFVLLSKDFNFFTSLTIILVGVCVGAYGLSMCMYSYRHSSELFSFSMHY